MANDYSWGDAIEACLENGDALLSDAECLPDWERYSTSFALAVLAQEEFAKAFLLHLVDRGVIKWGAGIRHLLTHHHSKHLVGVLIDWLAVPLEIALERAQASVRGDPLEYLPAEVAWAVNILSHKKLDQLLHGYALPEPEWSGKARKLAEGMLDRQKQAALYVSVSPKGRLGRGPKSIGKAQAQFEIERSQRFSELAADAHGSRVLSHGEYRLLCDVLAAVFADNAEGAD